MVNPADSILNQDSKLLSVEKAVQRVKRGFLTTLTNPRVSDLAFVGNASRVYVWEPCLVVDLDVCIFADQCNRELGLSLAYLRDWLSSELKWEGIEFYLKIIRGSYKHAPLLIDVPAIVAHVSLFTEEMYLARPVLLRWAWRKYPCTAEPLRLARLAPDRPTLQEFLNGRSGVAQKLASVESGSAPLVEYTLPDLTKVASVVSAGEPLFAEYCLAAGMICARNHARVLNKLAADCLNNREFVDWYGRELMDSASFRRLMALKEKVRRSGYAHALDAAPILAQSYLRQLRDWIGRELR